MPSVPRLRAAACLVCTLIAAGCGTDAPLPGETRDETLQFDARDKEIARALSVGSVRRLTASETPYAKAQLCTIALEAVIARLASDGAVYLPQLRVIEQARDIYSEREAQFGASQDRSPRDIVADRALQAQQVPDLSQRGQIAVGCLRGLV